MVQPTPAPGPRDEPEQQRRWVPALAVAAGVVAVAAVGAGALGVFDDDGPAPVAAVSEEPSDQATVDVQPAPTEPSVAPTPTADGPASTEPTEPSLPATILQVQAWYVTEYRPGSPGLVPETAQAETGQAAFDEEDTVAAALAHLFSAPPEDPDYSNSFATDAGVTADEITVEVGDAGTTVDVPAAVFSSGVGSQFAALGVQQLVQTVAANGGTGPVTVLVDGQPGAEVWGVLVLDEPLAVDESVRSLGWITSPAEGAVIDAGTITVQGTATGFEGEVDWEVLDAAGGSVVQSGFTAAGANGELGDVSFPVELTAGEYVVRLFEASEASAGEGPPVLFEDTTRFSVR